VGQTTGKGTPLDGSRVDRDTARHRAVTATSRWGAMPRSN